MVYSDSSNLKNQFNYFFIQSVVKIAYFFFHYMNLKIPFRKLRIIIKILG